MLKSKYLFGLAAHFLASACGLEDDHRSFVSKIDAVMDDHDPRGPGYAIGIFAAGEIAFAKGYGLADIKTAEAITPQTSFNLASLSKQFTGAAVANELIAEKISLDDSIAKHWPDLPAFMAPITIGHLVYMTSGLPEYYTLPSPVGGWASEDAFTVKDAMEAVFASGELEYEPGAAWSYSNINYQLLAELVARLNMQPFADYMHWAFFEPLEMDDCWVDDQLQHQKRDSAISYITENGAWRPAPRMSPHYGGSGVFCSLNDLAKWDNALFRSDEFAQTMQSTRAYNHDKTNDAFGLVHSKRNGRPIIWYQGGDYGVSTYMLRLVDEKKTIICLANFTNAGCRDKANAVADLLIEAKVD